MLPEREHLKNLIQQCQQRLQLVENNPSRPKIPGSQRAYEIANKAFQNLKRELREAIGTEDANEMADEAYTSAEAWYEAERKFQIEQPQHT